MHEIRDLGEKQHHLAVGARKAMLTKGSAKGTYAGAKIADASVVGAMEVNRASSITCLRGSSII